MVVLAAGNVPVAPHIQDRVGHATRTSRPRRRDETRPQPTRSPGPTPSAQSAGENPSTRIAPAGTPQHRWRAIIAHPSATEPYGSPVYYALTQLRNLAKRLRIIA